MDLQNIYSSYPNIRSKFDRNGRKARFQGTTKTDFLGWQLETRELLNKLLGLHKLESCPLNAEVVETVFLEGQIKREKILIQTEPGVTISAFLLIPQNKSEEEKACFIAPCGHLGGGKYAVAGALEIPGIQEKIQQFQYDYGLKLAKLGHVVLCPDARGFGESREGFSELKNLEQKENQKIFYECSCYQLSHMATAMGQTLAGMQVHDLMRMVDYLENRKEFNLENLGCIGFSGGGMQTLYLAALDSRIKQVFLSGYFYGFGDSLLIRNGNCNCNYIPGLLESLDCGDVGCLIAPRPIVIQSCLEDHLNGPRGIVNVEEQVEILRKSYQMFGKPQAVMFDVCSGPHSFHQEQIEKLLDNLQQQIRDKGSKSQ